MQNLHRCGWMFLRLRTQRHQLGEDRIARSLSCDKEQNPFTKIVRADPQLLWVTLCQITPSRFLASMDGGTKKSPVCEALRAGWWGKFKYDSTARRRLAPQMVSIELRGSPEPLSREMARNGVMRLVSLFLIYAPEWWGSTGISPRGFTEVFLPLLSRSLWEKLCFSGPLPKEFPTMDKPLALWGGRNVAAELCSGCNQWPLRSASYAAITT